MHRKSHSVHTAYRLTPLFKALLFAGLLEVGAVYGATITVDSTLDTSGNAAICTLRDAITAANTNASMGGCAAGAAGQDSINFAIPGAGVHTIVLGSTLPDITEPVYIDGASQPGYSPNSNPFVYPAGASINAQIMVEIDGGGLTSRNGVFHVATPLNTSTGIFSLSVGNYQGPAAFVLDGPALIGGNFIGVHADGTTPWLNKKDVSVSAGAHGSVIGSTGNPSYRNILQSVFINSHSVSVMGNLIGTDKSGATVLSGLTQTGIGAVGTLGANLSNAISNNVIGMGPSHVGILLDGAGGTTVNNNLVGVGVGGAPLYNQVGIWIDNANGPVSVNTVQHNTVAYSQGPGIIVRDSDGTSLIGGNSLDGNSIYGNTGLGIDLQPYGTAAGVTVNDSMDSDSGPNLLQNFPVITSALTNASGGIDIAFTLNSAASTNNYQISAYSNPNCHSSGHGEGKYLSGVISVTVATDASGNANGTFSVPAPLPVGWGAGQFVALLAHDANTNNTSEFSDCAMVAAAAANHAPVAVNDSYSTPFNTALTPSVSVLANDSDADGNPLTAVVSANPAHGSLTLSANGTFAYTPTAGYSGPDSFTYYANDGIVNSTAAATVSISVGTNQPPLAVSDTFSTTQNTALIVNTGGVLANDSDPDGNTITAILASGPSHGTLSLSANGNFVYTPAAGFSGADSFTYFANDGVANSVTAATVNITVSAAAPPTNPTTTTTPTNPSTAGFYIPLLNPIVSIPVDLPPRLDMNGGSGPAEVIDMAATLSVALAGSFTFSGQNASGTLRFVDPNGLDLAFTATSYQVGDGRSDGIYVDQPCGKYVVVSKNVAVNIAPALVNLEEFGALLSGWTLKLGDSGVIAATWLDSTYVGQPSYYIQHDTAGAPPAISTDANGKLVFKASNGNIQTLYPAFLEGQSLCQQLLTDGANETTRLPDATFRVGFAGVSRLVTPDYQLGSMPPERIGQFWWQEGPERYRVKVLDSQASQGALATETK